MTFDPLTYTIPANDEALLAECAVQVFRSSGPGGQSVNTTDSAVRLVHRPSGLRVQCQRERSQLRNKNECVRRLRERLVALQAAARRPKRKASRRTAASVERRIAAKKRTAARKQARRPPAEE
ncbi:MAG: peptide chain release factor family protein [Coriobacteriia bacterium]